MKNDHSTDRLYYKAYGTELTACMGNCSSQFCGCQNMTPGRLKRKHTARKHAVLLAGVQTKHWSMGYKSRSDLINQLLQLIADNHGVFFR